MRNINLYRTISVLGLILFLGISFQCKNKDDDQQTTTFEKREIMVQVADQYLIPAYQDLQNQMSTLASTWQDYQNAPSASGFTAVQNQWLNANLAFQTVKLIDFGPAYNNGFVISLGTFPCDTTQIKNNITAGTWDLAAGTNFAAIGFAALDYLLFKPSAMSAIEADINTKSYVSDVITKMLNETNAVVNAWSSYRATFVDGTGTSSTSPFAQLVNAFCKDYELAKNAKIGIPIGRQSLGIQRPEYLEARYSGYGKELLVANLKGLRNLYLGNSLTGAEGKGFDDYLIALDKAATASDIASRFDYLISRPDTWSGTISDMMQNNAQELETYYDYMQATVVPIKTDMASAFGILITYQDNDGD